MPSSALRSCAGLTANARSIRSVNRRARTLPSTATPNAAPNSLVTSFIADPTPALSGGRPDTRAAVVGVVAAPIPAPIVHKPTMTAGSVSEVPTRSRHSTPAAVRSSAQTMAIRSPVRATTLGTVGAAMLQVTEMVAITNPAVSTDSPSRNCRYCGIRNCSPHATKNPNVSTSAGTVNWALRKSRTSSIGKRRPSSQRTNAIPPAIDSATATRTGALDHPRSGASMNANTIPEIATIDSAAPVGSSGRPCVSRDSGTRRATSTSVTTTIGTLTSSTDPHQNHDSSNPPTGGPRMNPSPPTPDQMPMAWTCSSAGNTDVMIDRVPGMSIAAPTPITARAATSSSAVAENAPANAATPKTTRPTTRSRRRPNRSPNAPPVITRPAKTMP